MTCDKHGYTNGTFCPACDLEIIEKYTPDKVGPVSVDPGIQRLERYTHNDLLKWGQELDRELPRSLGEKLICYADDWRNEVENIAAQLEAEKQRAVNEALEKAALAIEDMSVGALDQVDDLDEELIHMDCAKTIRAMKGKA